MKNEVSIVLAAYNALEYTRACLSSIQEFTSIPYELVLVNNGSTDGTASYFDSFHNAVVLHHPQNMGFSFGFNQGMKACSGDYLVIINNDCIVSENWLENMLACAQSDPAIGMVGPRGNRINGIQRVEKEFNDLQHFHQFARTFNRPNPGKWFKVRKLVGFCLLIKRKVLDKVGYFDENYGIGTHEDRDYSIRVRLAGFEMACAGDVIVYHFSHTTFIANELDLQKIYRKNRVYYNKKWKTKRN